MRKLVDVRNEDQEKAFELHSHSDGLYLSVKCSDNKHHYKVVFIRVSDMIYQIIKAIGLERWRLVCDQMNIR